MATKTVVIEVSGGVGQDVYSDDDIRVVVVDWDDHEDDPAVTCAGEIKSFSLEAMPPETEEQIAAMQ